MRLNSLTITAFNNSQIKFKTIEIRIPVPNHGSHSIAGWKLWTRNAHQQANIGVKRQVKTNATCDRAISCPLLLVYVRKVVVVLVISSRVRLNIFLVVTRFISIRTKWFDVVISALIGPASNNLTITCVATLEMTAAETIQTPVVNRLPSCCIVCPNVASRVRYPRCWFVIWALVKAITIFVFTFFYAFHISF